MLAATGTFIVDAPDTNYMVLCSANHSNAAAGSGDQPDICAYTNKTVSGFDFTSWATGDAGPDDLFELSVAAICVNRNAKNHCLR